jgi:glycosyltransferase involved in cell wall biosynthesis
LSVSRIKPNLLDRIYLGLQAIPARRRERRRWRTVTGKGKQSPRVFYGYETLPGRAAPVSGGIVKVQDLERLYPNTPDGPDVLYLASSALPHHAAIMATAALRAGARLVVNQDGVAYAGWYGPGWEQANGTMRLLVQRAHYVFYQSQFAKRSADRFLGERSGPSEILHNAVDTDRFIPTETAGVPASPRLLVAGSHWYAYRVTAAVEALACLRQGGVDARLRVAGRLCWAGSQDRAAAEVAALAERMGVAAHVSVTGPYTQEEAVGIFQQADVLLNLQYNDVCPRLVVEAMACGVPVVYSASGGTPELVGDEGGVGVSVVADWNAIHTPGVQDIAAAAANVLARYADYSARARERAVARFALGPWLDRHAVVLGKGGA